MKKWEYKIYFAYADDTFKINELGSEGWELVSVVLSSVGFVFYFKREIHEQRG